MTALDRYSESQSAALYDRKMEPVSRPRSEDAERIRRYDATPRGLHALLAWFRERFTEEMPEDIHGAALWHDYVSRTEAKQGVQPQGGSLLGTPAWDDGFRRLMENSPKELEVSSFDGSKARAGDEHYARPMRAAIANVSGADENRSKRTEYLLRVAASGFDWYGPAIKMGIPSFAAAVYAEDALFVLYRTYSLQPRTVA